jgi:hypothetical protein
MGDFNSRVDLAPHNGWRCAALPAEATDVSIVAHGAAPTEEA